LHGYARRVHIGKAFARPVHALAQGVGIVDHLRAVARAIAVFHSFAPVGQIGCGFEGGGHGSGGGCAQTAGRR
jgi:hypothetical protein